MSAAENGQDEERRASPIERHVGDRLRLARKAHNLTQEALAEHLGVTFQQVQKYEKGINRISASRLHKAATMLDVPVSFFFPEADPPQPREQGQEQAPPESVADFLDTPEVVQLVLAFSRITDDNLRRRVLQLVQSVAAKRDD